MARRSPPHRDNRRGRQSRRRPSTSSISSRASAAESRRRFRSFSSSGATAGESPQAFPRGASSNRAQTSGRPRAPAKPCCPLMELGDVAAPSRSERTVPHPTFRSRIDPFSRTSRGPLRNASTRMSAPRTSIAGAMPSGRIGDRSCRQRPDSSEGVVIEVEGLRSRLDDFTTWSVTFPGRLRRF